MTGKLYGTLGPACADTDTLRALLRAGMRGVRLNLSHGPLAERAPWLESLRRAETAEGVSCELLIDLQGPQLRVGALFAPLTLREGDTLTLGEAFPVPPILTGNLQDGDELLLDDGALSLRVLDARAMTCRVERGGVLRSRKSLAVAGRELPASALTEMDMENLSRAREYGVTALMQPFVRGATDLRAVRAALRETGAQELKIFAKIENMTGLHRLDEILPLADVVVIARGDLGNAMPLWELPRAQTLIASKCRAAKRPFMVHADAPLDAPRRRAHARRGHGRLSGGEERRGLSAPHRRDRRGRVSGRGHDLFCEDRRERLGRRGMRREDGEMDKSLLRRIPKVDELLAPVRALCPDASAAAVTAAVRRTLDALREDILSGAARKLPGRDVLCALAAETVHRAETPSLRPVINATGVVLHTNLGRARLSGRAAKAAADAAEHYSTLEYDVKSGGRGSRNAHVEALLCRLTGAESALVVNNNAAAVLLLLTALTAGGEVVVSRGELVEIGGSFRVPEIMSACGATLREVGTTNKTRAADYAAAIGEHTRALMKVHTSNYRIVGFTESASREELAALAHSRGLPFFEDLGSGSLFDLEAFGIHGEPTLQGSVRAGADAVTCSGDKLLGGPQAGILVGKKSCLDVLKRHPLLRALRVDKMTLAALEATLRAYADGSAVSTLPTLAMLAASPEELRAQARTLCEKLTERGISAEVLAEEDAVGGGSVPAQTLPGFAAAVTPRHCRMDELTERLRQRETPVVARIAHERLLLCLRTLRPEEYDELVRAVAESDR